MDSSRLMQIIIVCVVALLLIGITYWRLAYKSPLRVAILDRKDKFIMLGLTLAYALISGVNLGSYEKFAEWQGDNTNKSIYINFTQPSNLTTFYYYYGMGAGNLNLNYTTTAGEHQSIPLVNNTGLYKWQSVMLPSDKSITEINLTTAAPPIELKHFAIFDANNKYTTNFNLSSTDGDYTATQNLVSDAAPSYLQNTSMSSMYFDEIYYGRTAWEYIHGQSPYAWVHPPFGVLLIALAILLFGMNPLGWRFAPFMCGVLMVPVMYVLAKKIFKSRQMAILASLLMMVDFMHFSMCRMSSIDSSSTLFVLLELSFFYSYMTERKAGNILQSWRALFWSGLFFGLAMSSKWDGVFTVPFLLGMLVYIEIFVMRPNIKQFSSALWRIILAMLVVPLAIYCMSFLPYYSHDPVANFVSFVYNVQGYMLGYHTGFTAATTHPYESNWWGWPLLTKPLSVFFWQETGGHLSSSIVVMGNPAIWWGGILAFVGGVILMFRKKDFNAVFLILAILTLYMPWTVFGRLKFDYYFYVVTPFWILMICYCLQWIEQQWSVDGRKFVYVYLALAVILFIMFYPAISGMPISRDYVVHYLLWFSPAWNF